MKNILLPSDFSENALNSILYALALFRGESCRFILLHSFRVNGYENGSRFSAIPSAMIFENRRTMVLSEMNDLMQELRTLHATEDHKFIAVASNDPLPEAIAEQIRKFKVELVVIGTQGSTASKDAVYGNNTINILEEVRGCPILAVPTEAGFKKIREIVFPNSFKIIPTKKDMNCILELSKRFAAPVRILHILENGGLTSLQEENKRHLQDLLREIPHSFHVLRHVSVPIGIYSFSASRNSDLIAFVNKKHSFLQQLLFPPLYKNLGHYSEVPVMVLQTDPNSDK